MLIITDIDSGKKYKVLPFENIKKGDFFIVPQGEVGQAQDDYPDTEGSFILEEIKETE